MEFIKKHKKAFLGIASILCVLTMILSVFFREKPTYFDSLIGYVVTPINKLVTNFSLFFTERVDFFVNINEISNKNNELLKENQRLVEDNKRLKLYEEENERLSELLNLSQKYPDYPKIGAQVIAKDPGNWYSTFIIDKGSNDGIQKNMVVLTTGGLAGRILEAGENYSKVVSIIEDTNTVASESIRTRDRGFLKGSSSLNEDGLCTMEHINMNAEIIEGDEIITSTLSRIYPPGISIGVVREIKTDISGLTKQAIVEPAVNFEDIRTVLVISEVFVKDLSNFEN